MRRLAAAVAAAFVSVAPAAARDIFVTHVKTYEDADGQKMAEVTLNNRLVIKRIKVLKVGNRTTLKLPAYVSRSGREYPDVEIDPDVYDAISNAVRSGQAEILPAKTKFTVTVDQSRFRPLRSQTRRANGYVTINGKITVTVGIMKSRRPGQDWWIAWPARKNEATGRWEKHVFFADRDESMKVEKYIIAQWEKSQASSGESDDGY